MTTKHYPLGKKEKSKKIKKNRQSKKIKKNRQSRKIKKNRQSRKAKGKRLRDTLVSKQFHDAMEKANPFNELDDIIDGADVIDHPVQDELKGKKSARKKKMSDYELTKKNEDNIFKQSLAINENMQNPPPLFAPLQIRRHASPRIEPPKKQKKK